MKPFYKKIVLFFALNLSLPLFGKMIEFKTFYNPKTGEKIYFVGDQHVEGKYDNQNAAQIINLQKKTEAFLIVENPFHYTGYTQATRRAIKKVPESVAFLTTIWNAGQASKANPETRHVLNTPARTPEEAYFLAIKYSDKIVELNSYFEKLLKKENLVFAPNFCKRKLREVQSKKFFKKLLKLGLDQKLSKREKAKRILKTVHALQNPIINLFNLSNQIIPETYGLTDIRIMRLIKKAQNAGYKTIIICAGADHNPREALLKNGFELKLKQSIKKQKTGRVGINKWEEIRPKLRLAGSKKPSVSLTQKDVLDIKEAMKKLDEMDEPKKPAKKSLGSEIMELLKQLEESQ